MMIEDPAKSLLLTDTITSKFFFDEELEEGMRLHLNPIFPPWGVVGRNDKVKI
jgi:hypothetical protein